jgi:hypothetical protein
MLLPERFLEWAYFERIKLMKTMRKRARKLGRVEVESAGSGLQEPSLLLETTRHNPVLCTASIDEKGHITVNGKFVGAGFVPKKRFLEEAVEQLGTHVESYADMSMEEYAKKGLDLLLELVYLEDREEAWRRVDFSKISTLELGKGRPGVAEHTWVNLQRYKEEACLVFYRPRTLSFEVRGDVEIHVKGPYHEFVNLVFECIHRTRPSRTNRPCLILNVKEVYDNSITPAGYGTIMT